MTDESPPRKDRGPMRRPAFDNAPDHGSPPDVDRFEALYDAYADDIFYFCYRRLNDADAANDATSRIFLKALNHFDAFIPHPERPGETFRAWLYRIARNELIDLRRGTRPVQSLDAQPHLKLVDPARSPEDHAIAADDARRIHAMLARLPDSQRAIVELRLAGLSGDEIAQTLGMTLSAVKSAQYRAYQSLRSALRSDDPQAR